MLTTLQRVFYYECLLLWRRANEWLYPIAFFLIVISLFPLAFSPEPAFMQKIIPGGVWIAALFANILLVETIFHADLEDGSLEQWLLSQSPLPLITIAKLSAHWLCTILPLILLTPVIGLMFQLSSHAILVLCLGLLLGTPILLLLGAFGVALTIGLRQQGVMLALLILPLSAPVLIFGVNMVIQSMAGFSVSGPLAMLAGLLVVSLMSLPFATAFALRLSLDD